MAQWTEDQQLAIDTNNKDILVAAAAGSGKTAVLVERVISHILLPESDKNHWDVDKLIVVTFTQAAAEEMRQRIESQLQKAIEEENSKEKPDKKRIFQLERQLILLSNATISTIHSFCQSIIRQNFTDLEDFDPAFRVIMENENIMLQHDVLEKLLERYYEEGNPFIYEFAEKYADRKQSDEELYKIVFQLYNLASNQPFPEKWLKESAERFDISDDVNVFETFWGKELKNIYADKLKGILDSIDEIRNMCSVISDPKLFAKVSDVIDKDTAVVNRVLTLLEEEKWDEMVHSSQVKFGTWASVKKEDEQLNESAKGKRDDYVKKPLAGMFSKFANVTEKQLVEDIRKLAPEVHGLCNLVLEFITEYAARKREKNVIDFNDMEHMALRILLDPSAEDGEFAPSNTAKELGKHCQEIMVDEYQDTNAVQDAIVRLIAGENSGKIFMVGDVKQSIYRFRSAEPALFQHKYKTYSEGANEFQKLICLSKNFRSRKDVLEGINFIFGQCMTEDPMEIAYDDRAALYAGLDYGEPKHGEVLDSNIEIHLYDKSTNDNSQEADFTDELDDEPVTDSRLEANMIARRLREIHDSGVMVYDKNYEENNHYRPIRWKDMVILRQSLTNDIPATYLKALQSCNIPAYSNKGDGYFDTVEIRIMTALLAVIDNSRQDIPLAAVLHSPIVGLTETELARLRLNCPQGDFFDVLLAVNSPDIRLSSNIKTRVARFLQQLSEWRKLSRHVSVAELIWQLYRDTGYYDFAGGLPGGLVRQANLRSLISHAEEFQNTDYKGLFRFLQFIRRMREMETDLEVARTLSDSEDVVRIMSIHKSKGLEFPVVVVAGMDKKFNHADEIGAIIASKDMGVGMQYTDIDTFQRYDTISKAAVAESIRRESMAEEMRVLYVALTRAREKLILTGKVSDYEKQLTKWCNAAQSEKAYLSKNVLLKAQNFLDWVMPAAIRHPELVDKVGCEVNWGHIFMGHDSHWTLDIYAADELNNMTIEEKEAMEQMLLIKDGEALPVESDGEIVERLNWKYDFAGTEKVPSKLSVSELKQRFSAYMDEEGTLTLEELSHSSAKKSYSFARPRFMLDKNEKSGISSTEYGTLMHSVMQHIDISKELTAEGITKQLDDMAAQGIILPEHKDFVNVDSVVSFFATDIGKRFMSAARIWRELPFSRMLKAKDFYPDVTDEEVKIFSQGVIDVLFEEADGKYVIVDYKTDRDTTPAVVKEHYALQLYLYSQAVEELLGIKVAERYLYMLRDSSIVPV